MGWENEECGSGRMVVWDGGGEVDSTTGELSRGPGGLGGCDSAETPRQCFA
jgi:hypothetical protein